MDSNGVYKRAEYIFSNQLQHWQRSLDSCELVADLRDLFSPFLIIWRRAVRRPRRRRQFVGAADFC